MKKAYGPVKLHTMRVERTYTGGKLLDQLQGITPATDGNRPEEWVASTITSRYADDPNTGLSVIDDGGNTRRYVRDLIATDPAAYLGPGHVANFGESMGFLAKLIDSDKRLNIQTHPDNGKAREYFNSPFGKTEAWYIIDTRIIDGQDPYIYLGFKPGITKDNWIKWIKEQDIESLEASLHKIPVKKGDVFLVESGMPHAIGSGCFLAEIQEPTDFTFRVEKMMNGSVPYPEEVYHQGIGYEKMFECFHYDSYALEELLAKTRIQPRMKSISGGHVMLELLSSRHTTRFSMDKLTVSGTCSLDPTDTFSTAVVLAGEGRLFHADSTVSVSKSTELFLPVTTEPLKWESTGIEALEVLVFYPPKG